MPNGLVYLRPARLTYVRAFGPYERSIPQAWDVLHGWLDRHGLNSPSGIGYGLARDNPARTSAEKCRYDACILMMPHFEDRALRELGEITLPGGPYSRCRKSGNYKVIEATVAGLHTSYVSPPDIRIDDRRPIVTIYLDDPRRFEPCDLRADLCVPVAAVTSRDRVIAAQAA